MTIPKQKLMKPTLISLLLLSLASAGQAQTRQAQTLSAWQFSRDSIQWQPVSVPHDWAISGPFDKRWDLQTVAIEQNGEKEKTEKSGRSGSLPWIGRGYYVTSLTVGDLAGRRATLEFDGAMAEPVVYVNGHKAGSWAYGYTPFRVDVTPYLHTGDNTLAVSLHNQEESSRWYPGAGLYRPVRLVVTPTVSLDPWQTFLRTTQADSTAATLSFDTEVKGAGGLAGLAVEVSVLNPKGWVEQAAHASVDERGHVHVDLPVSRPRLWSPETPHLYDVRVALLQDGRVADELPMKTGIRTISYSKERGFALNGQPRKFQGVCLHHDLGPLGAALNKAALIRQVKALKDMGADAIRTSHNLPSQMQMEVYDSLGMMVMAESFDMWVYPKCKNGYAQYFKDWSDRDITHLVLANRNHPSLVMYSIGNEIPEQSSREGRGMAAHLQDLCHQLDPTRPVTQGMDRVDPALKTGFAQVMDIPGFNYRVQRYDDCIAQLPQGFLLGSETASTVSSRGVYKFPVEFKVATDEGDGQVTGYDTEWCAWSNLPDLDFMMMEDRDYTIGQFVWTGYDYLGEPTPYDNYWPSRSSYFGILDLAGLPKDRYYLYRSVWNRRAHTLHMLPHWTWPGREGQVTPIFVYTDYPEAELFVNGKSQGRQRKVAAPRPDDHGASTPALALERAQRYRLMWNDVRYEPGDVRVVAYDAEGRRAAEQTVRTAGKAADIKVAADRTLLQADGTDLAYITVSLVDKQGTELPTATDNIDVEVSGAGTFKAICNGDATSLEVFTEPHMRLFSGKLVVTVQAADEPGDITVVVSDRKAKLQRTLVIKTAKP